MISILRPVLRSARALARDTRGATAAFFAVVIATLIGMAGVGIETGLWFGEKREYQTAADAAAISGAFQLAAQIPNACSGGTAATVMTPILQAGTTMATSNGYKGSLAVAGSSTPTTETLYINSPPTTGSYTSNKCAVEAILFEPKNSLISAAFEKSVTIATRAVALVKLNFGGGACDLSLNPTPNTDKANVSGITIDGNVSVTQPGCVMASNSTNSCSFTSNGNPTIQVSDIYTAGGDCLGSNTKLLTSGLVPVTGGDQIPDPFCGQLSNCGSTNTFSMPSCSGNLHNPSNTTITGGAYNKIQLDSGGPYTVSGTIYDCGSLTISSVVNSGTGGVTFVVGSGNKISFTGTGTLVAPTSGTFSGMIFYQPGDGTHTADDTINGGSSLILTGAVYLPGGLLKFAGNNATAAGTTACLEVVSYTMHFTGTSSLSNTGCTSAGISKINITNVVMAE